MTFIRNQLLLCQQLLKGLKEKGYEFEAYHEENHFPVNFWHDNRM